MVSPKFAIDAYEIGFTDFFDGLKYIELISNNKVVGSIGFLLASEGVPRLRLCSGQINRV
jgi:hypothetical protein